MAHDFDNLSGKNLVLEVACDLFMEKGYDGVSMQQIADAAHMTKGSPYYHFKGKDDLFAHAFMRRIRQLHDGLIAALDGPGPLRDRLVAAFAYVLTTTDAGVIRLLDDFKRVIGPDRAREYLDALVTPDLMLATYRDAFARSAAEYGLPLRFSPEKAAWAINALQVGTLHLCHTNELGTLTPERAKEMATEAIDLFMEGALA